ncbi:tyrosine-type recombinase/integrase [Parageobacillus toebii]|uniref:tyrosine-type recombinase/integrase n=1 Tax=Parageobacillus toebii TaxID=153151 RepID=UPI003D2C3AA6
MNKYPLFCLSSAVFATEPVNLDWSDINFANSLINIRKSKGKKQSSVPLSESLAKELISWKTYIENKIVEIPVSVFVNLKGERLIKNGGQLD